MARPNSHASNVDALAAFWNRHTFHDMVIESMIAVNQRLAIRVEEYALVVTGVTRFNREQRLLSELPAVWLSETVTTAGDSLTLTVETEEGDFTVTGKDVRMTRMSDMAILIPSVDC